jgi:hypothetical protein
MMRNSEHRQKQFAHTRKSSQFKKKYKIFWKSQFKAASEFLWSLSKGDKMTTEGDIC